MSKLILHVDDEPGIRELLAETLTEFGHRVISAGDPLEAMKLLEKERPSLVIVDLQLADCDGIEFVRSFKAKIPDVPVMMLTGVVIDPRVAQKSLGEIVNTYVSKTTPLGKIIEEVERLLAGA